METISASAVEYGHDQPIEAREGSPGRREAPAQGSRFLENGIARGRHDDHHELVDQRWPRRLTDASEQFAEDALLFVLRELEEHDGAEVVDEGALLAGCILGVERRNFGLRLDDTFGAFEYVRDHLDLEGRGDAIGDHANDLGFPGNARRGGRWRFDGMCHGRIVASERHRTRASLQNPPCVCDEMVL